MCVSGTKDGEIYDHFYCTVAYYYDGTWDIDEGLEVIAWQNIKEFREGEENDR